jgi:hypothetical protein
MKPQDKMARTLGSLALENAAAPGFINAETFLQVSPAGPSASITIPCPAITQRGSGDVNIGGGCTVLASTPGSVVTFKLQLGGVTIIQKRGASDAGGLASCSFGFIGALAAGANVFSIVATAAAGNVSIAGQEGWIYVEEIGG